MKVLKLGDKLRSTGFSVCLLKGHAECWNCLWHSTLESIVDWCISFWTDGIRPRFLHCSGLCSLPHTIDLGDLSTSKNAQWSLGVWGGLYFIESLVSSSPQNTCDCSYIHSLVLGEERLVQNCLPFSLNALYFSLRWICNTQGEILGNGWSFQRVKNAFINS